MATNRRRISKRRTARAAAVLDPVEAWGLVYGVWKLPFDSLDHARATWKEHKREVMAMSRAKYPDGRPWAWFAFEHDILDPPAHPVERRALISKLEMKGKDNAA